VNGYRIEAGEVETRLVAIPGVKEAAVVRQAGPAGAAAGARLVAHLVASAGAGTEIPAVLDENAIRQALREHLPEYMTPSAVVWHDALPLTRNGKVDRGQLTAVGPAVADRTAPAAGTGSPATEAEQKLIELWASVLRVAESAITPESDFYELGGESLAAARILTGVRKRFGVGIGLDRLHEMLTVRSMAAVVGAAVADKAAAGGGAS
jgi:acyl carrier protein